MKKLIRSLVRLLTVLVVVAIVGIIGAGLLANHSVRVAVERASSKALDVPVDIDQARLSILGGTLSLHDLTVANPPGYQQKTLIVLDRGDMRVNAGSLLSKVITARDIRLDGMKVALEQKGLDNNLRDVVRSLRREAAASGKRLQIDNLEITNITVSVKLLPIPGQADTVSFKLAPIKMTNLGDNEPLDVATLVTKVLLAVAKGITEQGGDVLPRDMVTGLSSVLDKAFDLGRAIFGNGDAGSRLEEGLKNLVTPKNSGQP
jgi:hypothetical protein